MPAPSPAVTSEFLMFSSKWLAMNVLMLDPQRVMVEKKEVALQKVWESVLISPSRIVISIQTYELLYSSLKCQAVGEFLCHKLCETVFRFSGHYTALRRYEFIC